MRGTGRQGSRLMSITVETGARRDGTSVKAPCAPDCALRPPAREKAQPICPSDEIAQKGREQGFPVLLFGKGNPHVFSKSVSRPDAASECRLSFGGFFY